MALVPGVGTVLDAVADQGVVDAHAAVAEEGAARAGSCGERGNRAAETGKHAGDALTRTHFALTVVGSLRCRRGLRLPRSPLCAVHTGRQGPMIPDDDAGTLLLTLATKRLLSM